MDAAIASMKPTGSSMKEGMGGEDEEESGEEVDDDDVPKLAMSRMRTIKKKTRTKKYKVLLLSLFPSRPDGQNEEEEELSENWSKE